MSEHVLHLIEITEEGYAQWDFDCTHPTEPDTIPEKWQGVGMTPEDGCWFYSWWDALGCELIGHLRVCNPKLPLPVRPSDDWDYEDGGTIVIDDGPYPKVPSDD